MIILVSPGIPSIHSQFSLHKIKFWVVLIYDAYCNIFLDVQTATEMGISVYTVPGCCTEEVADSTMCHILNLYRRLTFLNESVRQGKITP